MKRRDPWPRANAPPKAAADPGLSGGDAKSKSQTCLHLVCRLVAQPSVEQAEKPHSKFSGRKALDGPATRPETPLAVENGVGKLTAPERGAPNVGTGKRAWQTPIPHLSPLDRKVGRGLMVFGGAETSNNER